MVSKPYEGGCHCGAIRWIYRTDLDPSQWAVRACQCSFCRAHAAACTSDPAGSVEFSANDDDSVLHYRFGLKCADFLVCAKCGVYVGAMTKVASGAFATLNLNSMKTAIEQLAEPTPIHYDAEPREGRIARRVSRWTPVGTVI